MRRAALEALYDITQNGAYSNLRLKQAFGQFAPQQKKFIAALVYTTLENLIYIDYIIDAYAKGRLQPKMRCILRLGVCQMVFMRVSDATACDESVKLAKTVGKGALASFVNGVLRNVARALPDLPQDPVARLALTHSWPVWLVERWVEQYGIEFAQKMLNAAHSGGVTVRAHPPRGAAELEQMLREKGIEFTRGTLDDNAFHIPRGADEALLNAPGIAVQSEGAMAVCRALGVRDGMRVLDACAAPGGKTAYLAALAPDARFTAWDIHPHRVELMQSSFARLGVNARTQVCDAAEEKKECVEAFDAVLIDAPCSGYGVAGTKPELKYRRTPQDIDEIAKLQRAILKTCARYVKPGGVLVYATCTVSKTENEDNLEWFERECAQFSPSPLAPHLEGIDAHHVQLFAHDGAEGFFIARYTRN